MNKNLRIARTKKGISQKELAVKVGVTNKYISLIESKGLKPSAEVMWKISKCVDASVQELFFYDMEE